MKKQLYYLKKKNLNKVVHTTASVVSVVRVGRGCKTT